MVSGQGTGIRDQLEIENDGLQGYKFVDLQGPKQQVCIAICEKVAFQDYKKTKRSGWKRTKSAKTRQNRSYLAPFCALFARILRLICTYFVYRLPFFGGLRSLPRRGSGGQRSGVRDQGSATPATKTYRWGPRHRGQGSGVREQGTGNRKTLGGVRAFPSSCDRRVTRRPDNHVCTSRHECPFGDYDGL